MTLFRLVDFLEKNLEFAVTKARSIGQVWLKSIDRIFLRKSQRGGTQGHFSSCLSQLFSGTVSPIDTISTALKSARRALQIIRGQLFCPGAGSTKSVGY
jgi:hypothetical protein